MLVVRGILFALWAKRGNRPAPLRVFNPEDGLQPIIPTNLITHKDELCFLMVPASAAHSKEVTVGYSGRSSGVSVRVAKGITLHTSGSKGVPVKRNVMEKYPGTLYVTNEHIVMVSQKYGFEKKLNSLVSATQYRDGLAFQFGNTSYLVFTSEPLYVYGIIQAVIESYNT